MMLRITIIAVWLCVTVIASAALGDVPHTINYQGRLTDSGGQPVGGSKTMVFDIYNDESAGDLLWSETHLGVQVSSGLFTVILGAYTSIPDSIFDETALWLEITVAGETISPRTELTSAPYTLSAHSVHGDIHTAPGQVGIGVTDPVENLVVGKNIGARSGNRIMIGDDTPGVSTGLVVGQDGSNRGWLLWNVDDNFISLGTEQQGGLYGGTLTLDSGKVGINNSDPREPLSVGDNLGGQPGDLISIGNSGGHSGVMFGEDSDNVGRIIWNSTENYMCFIPRDGGTTYNTMYLKQDNVGIGDDFPTYRLTVNGTGKFVDQLVAVWGYADATGSGISRGVIGEAHGGSGTNAGVFGTASGSGTNWAGYFSGDVNVTGTLVNKGGGSFQIDHPLDPENKWLNHSSVESPDMMNVYNGNVILDANGEVSVELPEYFEALNRDFRYQLTCIGGFAPVYIAEKIEGNRFTIAGGEPGMEVSWQVTGVRKDAFANANRIEVEVNKKPDEQGKFAHPEAFGLDATMSIDYRNEQETQNHEGATNAN